MAMKQQWKRLWEDREREGVFLQSPKIVCAAFRDPAEQGFPFHMRGWRTDYPF